jgi:hypothetical protein
MKVRVSDEELDGMIQEYYYLEGRPGDGSIPEKVEAALQDLQDAREENTRLAKQIKEIFELTLTARNLATMTTLEHARAQLLCAEYEDPDE